MKICKICGKEFKPKSNNQKYCCNRCIKINQKIIDKIRYKKFYEKNEEKIKEYQKKYRENNKEKIKEYRKKYYEENKGKINEYHKKYRENNKENLKELNKKYRENNKEKIKEYQKKINEYDSKNLTGRYIKSLLTNKMSLKFEDIPQEIIEMKRQHLMCFRKLNQGETK